MTRKELLEQIKSDKKVINIDRIIRRDEDFILQEQATLKRTLHEVEDSIEDWLKDPNLTIDGQFLTLIKKRKTIKFDLEILEETKNYL